METSAKYEAGQISRQTSTREQVLYSPYFQCVASTADSMIMAGGLCPVPDTENFDVLIESAINFTDRLIEKVGERL